MPSVEEWLNQYYPLRVREFITDLECLNLSLTGELDLKDFTNLKNFNCYNNQIVKVDASRCLELEELGCSDNQITKLILPPKCKLKELRGTDNFLMYVNFSALRSECITWIDLRDNDFSPQGIRWVTKLVNLERLMLGTTLETTHSLLEEKLPANWKNKYNRWTGSLFPLRNLTKLESLDLSLTNLTNPEYIPLSKLNWFRCRGSKVAEEIKKYKKAKENWVAPEFSPEKFAENGLKFIPNQCSSTTLLKRWKQANPKIINQALNERKTFWLMRNKKLFKKLILPTEVVDIIENHYQEMVETKLVANIQLTNGLK